MIPNLVKPADSTLATSRPVTYREDGSRIESRLIDVLKTTYRQVPNKCTMSVSFHSCDQNSLISVSFRDLPIIRSCCNGLDPRAGIAVCFPGETVVALRCAKSPCRDANDDFASFSGETATGAVIGASVGFPGDTAVALPCAESTRRGANPNIPSFSGETATAARISAAVSFPGETAVALPCAESRRRGANGNIPSFSGETATAARTSAAVSFPGETAVALPCAESPRHGANGNSPSFSGETATAARISAAASFPGETAVAPPYAESPRRGANGDFPSLSRAGATAAFISVAVSFPGETAVAPRRPESPTGDLSGSAESFPGEIASPLGADQVCNPFPGAPCTAAGCCFPGETIELIVLLRGTRTVDNGRSVNGRRASTTIPCEPRPSSGCFPGETAIRQLTSAAAKQKTPKLAWAFSYQQPVEAHAM